MTLEELEEELEELLEKKFPGKNATSIGEYHVFLPPKVYKEFIKALENEFKNQINNMELEEYQKNAVRTMAETKNEKLDLAHMVIGMTSEINELYDAIDNNDKVNTGEELSDIMWYLANYCTLRGYKLELFYNRFSQTVCHDYINIQDITCNVSKLTDLVKKKIYYNRDIEVPAEQELIENIIIAIQGICEFNSIIFNNILQNNIDKLKKRFPDKFCEEKANNRNLDEELKELKK